jgi:hypothetical protein
LFAGPTVTNMWGNGYLNKNNGFKLSFFAGGGITLSFRERSFAAARLFYERKGFKEVKAITFRDANNKVLAKGDLTINSTYDYITMTLMYGWKFGEDDSWRLHAGPYIAYLLHQKNYYSELYTSPAHSDSQISTIKRIDLGLSLGLEKYIRWKETLDIKFGVLTSTGLLNISKVPVYDNESIRHLSIDIVAGMVYKLDN